VTAAAAAASPTTTSTCSTTSITSTSTPHLRPPQMFSLYAVFVGQDLVRNFCIPCGDAIDSAFGMACDL
jgi:hypothetical protein